MEARLGVTTCNRVGDGSAVQARNTSIAGEERIIMTDKELQEAIRNANKDVKSLSSSPPSGPFPQREVRHREMILLRQMTLYKIENAKKCKRKDLERFNTEIYDLITTFVKSH